MSETILMERETSGVAIRLKWMPIMDMIVLEVLDTTCDYARACTVAKEDAIDAFVHPFCGKYVLDDPFTKEVTEE